MCVCLSGTLCVHLFSSVLSLVCWQEKCCDVHVYDPTLANRQRALPALSLQSAVQLRQNNIWIRRKNSVTVTIDVATTLLSTAISVVLQMVLQIVKISVPACEIVVDGEKPKFQNVSKRSAQKSCFRKSCGPASSVQSFYGAMDFARTCVESESTHCTLIATSHRCPFQRQLTLHAILRSAKALSYRIPRPHKTRIQTVSVEWTTPNYDHAHLRHCSSVSD